MKEIIVKSLQTSRFSTLKHSPVSGMTRGGYLTLSLLAMLLILPILLQASTIGDKVWDDANQNGMQNAGEAGIEGVTVELEIYGGPTPASPSDFANPANWSLLATTTTISAGAYTFTGLDAGDYRLKFGLKTGYTFTMANQTNDSQDSDVDVSGYTHRITLTVGLINNTVDAGMYSSTVLPVKLTSFGISKGENNSAVLRWATAEEVDSDYFGIERSDDARSWVQIAKVFAKGNHHGLVSYEYADNDTGNGSNYYRLRMVDTDGTFAYSTMKEVSLESKSGAVEVVTYPNPVSRQLFIKTSSGLQIVSAKIIDVSGRETLAATQSQLTNGIDVDRLSNGMYFVRMILEDGKTSLQKIAIAK